MSGNDDTLARLTFNATAMRDYLGEDAKGVRLKIERNVVTFRPAKSLRGVDVIAIERRPRGTTADVVRDVLSRRLMQRLFKAGLTTDQPYFVLEPAGRGWFGIDHVPDQQTPPRQPLMVVSDFEMPPSAIDLLGWQRFLRIVTSGRPISDETWKPVAEMVRSAEQIVARKGRRTQERDLAERLLGGVERNAEKLLAWGERQPEFATEITSLLTRLGVEIETPDEAPLPEAASEAPEPEPEPEAPVAEEADEQVISRPRRQRRKSRSGPPSPPPEVVEDWIVDEVDVTVVEVDPETVVETEDAAPPDIVVTESEGVLPEADTHEEEVQAETQAGTHLDDDPDEPEPPEPEAPQDDRLQEVQDQAILSAWEHYETLEPNISTDRLMTLVEDHTGADRARQIEALHRAGWPIPHEG